MNNPYRSGGCPADSSSDEVPQFWWWPIAAGIFVTPICFWMATSSYEFSNGVEALVLFPTADLFISFLGLAVGGTIIFSLQYVSYGVFLAMGLRKRRLSKAVERLLLFHIGCYLVMNAI